MPRCHASSDQTLGCIPLAWALRDRFPLHLIVFKQTACHLPHEANVEQLFSRAGLLTDPNMDPQFLAKLTSIAMNKAAYEPSTSEIKAKYFDKYRGKGGEGLPSAAGPSGSSPGPSDLSQA